MKIDKLARSIAPALLIHFKRQLDLLKHDYIQNAKTLRSLKQRKKEAQFPGGFDEDIKSETRYLAEDRKEIAALKIAIKALKALNKE